MQETGTMFDLVIYVPSYGYIISQNNVSIHQTGAVAKWLTKIFTEFHFLGPILKLPYKQIQLYGNCLQPATLAEQLVLSRTVPADMMSACAV
jgi:hypothetical protein